MEASKGRVEYVNVSSRALSAKDDSGDAGTSAPADGAADETAAAEVQRPVLGVAVTLGSAATSLTFHQVERGRAQLKQGVAALKRLAGMDKKKAAEAVGAGVTAGEEPPAAAKEPVLKGAAAIMETISSFEARSHSSSPICHPLADGIRGSA